MTAVDPSQELLDTSSSPKEAGKDLSAAGIHKQQEYSQAAPDTSNVDAACSADSLTDLRAAAELLDSHTNGSNRPAAMEQQGSSPPAGSELDASTEQAPSPVDGSLSLPTSSSAAAGPPLAPEEEMKLGALAIDSGSPAVLEIAAAEATVATAAAAAATKPGQATAKQPAALKSSSYPEVTPEAMEALLVENATLRAERVSSEASYSRLEVQYRRLEGLYESLLVQYKGLSKDYTSMEAQYNRMKQLYDSMNDTHGKVRKELFGLQKQHSKLQNEHARMVGALAAAKK